MLDEVFGRRVYGFTPAQREPLIIDGGANIGLSVLFFKRLAPQARILAFEHNPASFALLRRNLAANRAGDVEAVAAALGDRDGDVELYVAGSGSDAGGAGSSLIASTRPERVPAATALRVPMVRLSSRILALGAIVDLLKLDIEGGEEAVLADLAATGALSRIAEMHVEYHHHVRPGEDRLAGFLARLEEHGFGYQLAASVPAPAAKDVFQDVLIHAYRRPREPR